LLISKNRHNLATTQKAKIRPIWSPWNIFTPTIQVSCHFTAEFFTGFKRGKNSDINLSGAKQNGGQQKKD
jgi:hypothetical protein